MSKTYNNSHILKQESGIAHLGLLLILVLVVSVSGFVGYNIYQNNSSRAETADFEESTECFVVEDGIPADCESL